MLTFLLLILKQIQIDVMLLTYSTVTKSFFVVTVLNFNSNKATIKLIDHSDATKVQEDLQ